MCPALSCITPANCVLDMALRIGQILDLSPDFVEIITWNDVRYCSSLF